jgi:hypothetical protein
MWAKKERISRYSVQYMLSDVAMLDPVRVVVMLSPNQTVRIETDGTSEPALAAGRSGPNTFRADLI